VKLILGFIPLLDCASLVVAAERSFAAEEDLELTLVRETSWANIRDRVVIGHFDAAHMLGPMTVASTLGIGHVKVPVIAPFALGLGGNAITVSLRLWEQMLSEGACAEKAIRALMGQRSTSSRESRQGATRAADIRNGLSILLPQLRVALLARVRRNRSRSGRAADRDTASFSGGRVACGTD